jgi:hypothetical protein
MRRRDVQRPEVRRVREIDRRLLAGEPRGAKTQEVFDLAGVVRKRGTDEERRAPGHAPEDLLDAGSGTGRHDEDARTVAAKPRGERGHRVDPRDGSHERLLMAAALTSSSV